jgi:uncharacterized protein (DUF1800 family)
MDRRKFLSAYKKQSVKKAAFLPSDPVSRTSSSLSPYSGPWTQNEVIHLLKRTMFGSKKVDVDYFKALTMDKAVDELLDPVTPLPAPPVKEYDTSGTITTPDTNIAAGTTWVDDPNNDGTITSRRRASFKKWWMGNMVNQDRSIREKITLFWHNHLATETNDIGNSQFVYKHHALLRANALGNFKSLVKAITLDPAMLVYLNGRYNTATAPDENYGRELLELFCCGKGPGSLYTEADVKAAAKVLTGWQVNTTTLTSYFTASRHDKTNKQFSPFFNNTVITGNATANGGDIEIDALLNMIFNVPEVANYICRRLYRWFVYYDIDGTVEANVIEPLAAILRANNYELKPVVSALLKSEHFYDVLNHGCQIKSPVDLVVGMCREFDVQFQPATDYMSNYGLWNFLVTTVSNMQQNIGDPPDVSGWKAYYQEPQFYEIWINSDTLPKRNQFTDQMTVSGYTFSGKRIMIDGTQLFKQLPTPEDPNQLVANLSTAILRMPLSAASMKQIKTDILLSGQANDTYWTDAWNLYISTPGNSANATTVRNRVRDLLKYFMNLAEYQLA